MPEDHNRDGRRDPNARLGPLKRDTLRCTISAPAASDSAIDDRAAPSPETCVEVKGTERTTAKGQSTRAPRKPQSPLTRR